MARIGRRPCSENRHAAHGTSSAQRTQRGGKRRGALIITLGNVVWIAFIGVGIALAYSVAQKKPWINTPHTNDETSLNSGG